MRKLVLGQNKVCGLTRPEDAAAAAIRRAPCSAASSLWRKARATWTFPPPAP